MAYCVRHGGSESFSSSCPLCAAEERHEENLELTAAAAEATIEAIRKAEYKRANPGDYRCPECGFITLNRSAHRCPKCHGVVPDTYWAAVQRAEEQAAEAKRAESERRRAHTAAKLAEGKKEYLAYQKSHPYTRLPYPVRRCLLLTYRIYLLPTLVGLSAALWRQFSVAGISGQLSDVDTGWSLIPGLNWLWCFGGLLNSDERFAITTSLAVWVIVDSWLTSASINPHGPAYQYERENSAPARHVIRDNRRFLRARTSVLFHIAWDVWRRRALVSIAILVTVTALAVLA